MKKASWFVGIVGLVVVGVLVASMAGTALAQSETPPTPAPGAPPSGGRRGGGPGGMFGKGPQGQVWLEAAAEALGMTADELSTQLKGGATLASLADKAGVDLQTVRDAVKAAQLAAQKEAIQQAVTDGKVSQEQADWMLEGLDKGYQAGPGLGKFDGRGKGHNETGLEAAAEVLGLTADELSLQLWGGRTLADLADKAGVDLQDVQDAMKAANLAAQKEAIEQAVQDGKISQDQADWLLEGLDNGYMGGLGGRNPGRAPHGPRGGGAPGGIRYAPQLPSSTNL